MDESKVKERMQVVSPEQFAELAGDGMGRRFLERELKNIRFSKVEQFCDGLLGTFVIPDQKRPSTGKIICGFLLRGDELFFFSHGGFVEDRLRELEKYQLPEMTEGAALLFYFMEHLVEEDSLHLQQYDDRLSGMEEQLMEREAEGFDRDIFRVRKNLSALGTYYQQLCDMCERLQQYCQEQEADKISHQFELLSGKLGRLYSMVQMLTDYSIQLREMHQTKIATKQNQVMQTLTIVATIFMPLTLVAGWYGMNFSGMPELKSKAGYPIVCLICVAIATIEIYIFKKKKWF